MATTKTKKEEWTQSSLAMHCIDVLEKCNNDEIKLFNVFITKCITATNSGKDIPTSGLIATSQNIYTLAMYIFLFFPSKNRNNRQNFRTFYKHLIHYSKKALKEGKNISALKL